MGCHIADNAKSEYYIYQHAIKLPPVLAQYPPLSALQGTAPFSAELRQYKYTYTYEPL